MKKILIFIVNIPKYILQGFIWVYKKCISPFLPHVCKFTPTCSTYAMQCFQEWGFFKGSLLSIKRIFISFARSRTVGVARMEANSTALAK